MSDTPPLSRPDEPSESAAQDRRRPVRSFVLRQGRLTAAQERAFVDLWPRYGVDWAPGTPLDLSALFGNDRPVVLEIGFGNGDSLAAMALAQPLHHWLGVEVHGPGVGHLLLTAERLGLANLRVVRHDAVQLRTAGPGRFAERPAARPLTRFEQRGERLGHQVRDLLFRRN